MSSRYYRRKIQINVPARRKSQRENPVPVPIVPSMILSLSVAGSPTVTHTPFRWNIARREQLGSLVDGNGEANRLDFAEELISVAANILAFAGDADLVFLGRSPESLFDLLRGVLSGTPWQHRIQLLPFSLGRSRHDDIPTPEALAAYRLVLEKRGLLPEQIAFSTRPIAFVDIVASGTTFHNWISLLKRYADLSGTDWNAVRRKLRLVGICRQEETSPKTWRWQQHAPWLRELIGGCRQVKNVPVTARLYHHLADYQPKTTCSYFPSRWGRPLDKNEIHAEKHLEALRQARSLFDTGTTRGYRLSFAKELGKQREIQHAWLRGLICDLKWSAGEND